ncbi:hypothetical protein ID866_8953 [Astraeus odoratus]|nr:hypothetical protein ID866_8953 [Astraeus odoratus]
MNDTAKLAICATLAVTFTLAVLRTWRNPYSRNGLLLPPGPKGLPFIGSLLEVNVSTPLLTYEKWRKQYGGIIYSRLLGKDYVIINHEDIAHELLVRRSSIYSDRPYIISNELFGIDFNTVFMQHGKMWRLHRQLYNTGFSKQRSAEYKEIQLKKVHQLLLNMLSAPHDYIKHYHTLSSSIIMAITYGYDAAPEEDPFINNVTQAIDILVHVMTPERATLLSTFPIRGRYKQHASKCRALVRHVLNDPFNYVKNCMSAGTASKSFVHHLLEKKSMKSPDQNQEEVVKEVAATAFLAGSETTTSVLLVFLLAMVLHPEVQVRAQKEIDQVVGQDRLPNFNDKENLPYIEAICLETLRWVPVLPLGVPHRTTTDDVFDGMFIPKGATVIPNIWAMARNKERFPEPLVFNPDRHLTSDGKVAENTSSPVFGFGRRLCLGMHVADQTLWATMTLFLAAFHVSKAKDDDGNYIDVIPEFVIGVVQSSEASESVPVFDRAAHL